MSKKQVVRTSIIIACTCGIVTLSMVGAFAVSKPNDSQFERLGVNDVDNEAPVFVDYNDGRSEVIKKEDFNRLNEKTSSKSNQSNTWDTSIEPATDIEVLGTDDIDEGWELIDPVDDLEK